MNLSGGNAGAAAAADADDVLTVNAPPGRLGIILHPLPSGGTVVAGLRSTSPLVGVLKPGDRIVSIDETDVSSSGVPGVVQAMQQRPHSTTSGGDEREEGGRGRVLRIVRGSGVPLSSPTAPSDASASATVAVGAGKAEGAAGKVGEARVEVLPPEGPLPPVAYDMGASSRRSPNADADAVGDKDRELNDDSLAEEPSASSRLPAVDGGSSSSIVLQAIDTSFGPCYTTTAATAGGGDQEESASSAPAPEAKQPRLEVSEVEDRLPASASADGDGDDCGDDNDKRRWTTSSFGTTAASSKTSKRLGHRLRMSNEAGSTSTQKGGTAAATARASVERNDGGDWINVKQGRRWGSRIRGATRRRRPTGGDGAQTSGRGRGPDGQQQEEEGGVHWIEAKRGGRWNSRIRGDDRRRTGSGGSGGGGAGIGAAAASRGDARSTLASSSPSMSAPGAYAVAAVGAGLPSSSGAADDDGDIENVNANGERTSGPDLPDSNDNEDDEEEGLPTAIPATLVEDDDEDQLPLVVAMVDRRKINFHDRQVRIGLGLVVVVIVSLSVGLGVSLSGNGGTDGGGGDNGDGIQAPPAGVDVTALPSMPPSDPPSSFPSQSTGPSTAPSTSPSSRPTFMEWTQTGQDINGPGSFENFGSAISLSADGARLAVGTPSTTNGGASGSVHVFERRFTSSATQQKRSTSFSWEALSLFAIEGDGANDQAGRALSISGDGSILAVGYPFNSNDGLDDGMARIFAFDPDRRDWVQEGDDLHYPSDAGTGGGGGGGTFGDDDGVLRGDDAWSTAGVNFGYSLSLSKDGTTVAVSTRSTSGGTVHVYRRHSPLNGTVDWIPLGEDVDKVEWDKNGYTYSDTPFQGTSVALSANGTRLAVVDYGDEDVTLGFLRVYEHNATSSSWDQVGTTQRGQIDYFGSSLDLSDDGTVVAVAGLRGGGYADNVVLVYRFDAVAHDWVWSGALDDGDGFLVRSVSLSGDGDRIAVQESGGVVRVCDFDREAQLWRPAANQIDAAGVPEYRFDGETISLASDGAHVAIGAPEIGTVRLFSLTGV